MQGTSQSGERYQRIRRIGQGGMGIVYEAEDRVSRRRVALKTLRNDDPNLLYRLKREFRTLARVSHQNLVRLHELSSDKQGYFFTMDLVDGVDFLEHLGDRTEEPEIREQKLRLSLAQLGRGLQALHDEGFVHRDIKPSNVLVERDGRVVIVDFGLVSPVLESASRTLSADTAGTAAYMAPEQLQSELPVGPAADYYAVGVMLFEALTSRRPFLGSDLDVLRQKTDVHAPDVRQLAPEAPEDLAAICMQLLSREPEQRRGHALIDLARSGLPPSSRRRVARPGAVDFAGRGAELLLLHEELRAVNAGACRVVLLRGQSGMGKSALAREFLDQCVLADEDSVVLAGRCYQRESLPYKALDTLVDQLSSFWKRLPRAEAMFLLPREPEFLLTAFPVLGRVKVVTEMATPPARAMAPHEALTRSLAACRETLQRLGRCAPLILCLDDVQWIDPDSTRLLRFLTESNDPPVALILLISRPLESVDPTHELLEPLLQKARIVDVGPLPDEQMRVILGRVAGSGDNAAVEELVREARGSPFFGVTLARQLALAGGQIALDLDTVLLRQVAEVSALGHTLLELAAVAGRPLSREVAERVMRTEADVIGRELLRLESSNLTRSGAGVFVSHFEPYHDRIREFVLGQLTPARSRDLHGWIAAALEAESEVDSDACARHYKSAGQLGKAAAHARHAAERAENELGFVRAAEHYRLCLELPDLPQPERAHLHRKLADALGNAGRGAEAAEEYLAAAAQSNAHDRVHCERRAAEEFLRSGNPERGLETLRSVLAQVTLNYPTSTAWAVGASLLRHRLTKLVRLPKTLDDARAADPDLLLKIDVCSSVAHCVGFLDPLMTSYYQGLYLQLALKARERSRLCRALAAEGIYAALPGGESAPGQALLQSAQRLAVNADPRTRGVTTYSGGVIAFMQGKWRAARDLCEQGEQILRGSCTGVQWELDTTMLYILASLCAIGEFVEAGKRSARHTEEAQARRDSYALTILRAGSSHILRLAHGQPEQVVEEVKSVMSVWPSEPFSIPRYWELSSLTNADLYTGNAGAALERFAGWTRRVAPSLPLRVQVTRIRMRHARARATLAVAAEPGANRELLEQVLSDAEALEAEHAPWALALSTVLRAGVAAIQKELVPCLLLLESAEKQLLSVDMLLDAAVVKRRRGELVGGTEGAELIDDSTQWMKGIGVRDPSAFARVYAPGFVTG